MEIQNEDKQPMPQEPKEPVKSKKKMSLGKKIGWLIVAIIVFVVVVQILVADKYSAQVIAIPGTERVGVNPTTEQLDFGDLSGDTSATRYVTLNADGSSTFIHVSKFGSIAELIKLNDNDFTLNKGDEKRLELTLYMPPSAPDNKKYTGKVWIFKIPKFW